MSQPEIHVIDDFERPRLPLPLRVVNSVAGPFARRVVSLEPERLRAMARKATGLSDFGDPSFEVPLEVMTTALETEAELTAFGRFSAQQLIVGLLKTRLRVENLISRHPEILEEKVTAPIIIVGLPRTGTTHLHNLISQDPSLRSLPYWESLEPVPEDGERGPVKPDDPRIARCEQGVKFLHWAMPLFPLMHEMAPWAIHEEVQLLAVDLSTMVFEATYQIPSYRDWYMRTDQTGAYRTMRKLLQVLQWLRGGERWILKSPQHLEQLGPLIEVFPDARIVQTHRDPVRVTASFVTMGAYALRVGCGPIDPIKVGQYWSDRIEKMLNKSVEDRGLVPEGQIMDCRFNEFMGDELAMVESIYSFADQPLGEELAERFRDYLEQNRRGRLGRIDYRLADFGLDEAERRRALSHYQRRFDLPDE